MSPSLVNNIAPNRTYIQSCCFDRCRITPGTFRYFHALLEASIRQVKPSSPQEVHCPIDSKSASGANKLSKFRNCDSYFIKCQPMAGTEGNGATEILDCESWSRNELIQEIFRLRMQLAQKKEMQDPVADSVSENVESDPVAATRKNIHVDADSSAACVAKTQTVLSRSTLQTDDISPSLFNPSESNRNSCSCHGNLSVSAYLLTKADHFFVLTTLLLQLCVYIPTCYPTIAGGDSAEIIAAACTTGIFLFSPTMYVISTHAAMRVVLRLLFLSFISVFHVTQAWRIRPVTRSGQLSML